MLSVRKSDRNGRIGSNSTLLAGWAAQIASQLRGGPGYKRSRAALRALDDRILKDIGIGRHEIDHVVCHGRRWS